VAANWRSDQTCKNGKDIADQRHDKDSQLRIAVYQDVFDEAVTGKLKLCHNKLCFSFRRRKYTEYGKYC
jgi:hypothetical protein